MIATAAALLHQDHPDVLSEPHAWLGLPADTTDAGAIVAAARRRLQEIRDAFGSEEHLKEVLTAIVVAARQKLLARCRGDACD